MCRGLPDQPRRPAVACRGRRPIERDPGQHPLELRDQVVQEIEPRTTERRPVPDRIQPVFNLMRQRRDRIEIQRRRHPLDRVHHAEKHRDRVCGLLPAGVALQRNERQPHLFEMFARLLDEQLPVASDVHGRFSSAASPAAPDGRQSLRLPKKTA